MATVLIADDDAETRHALRALLEDAGYDVLEAPDGATALGVLESSPRPLVALLDYRMPTVNGTGVVAALADEEGRLRTPHALVLLTAANTRLLGETFTNLFPGQYVPIVAKPFDLDVVLETVGRAAASLS